MARILVVDDEESVCRMLRDVLADAGYQVEVAEDGRQALELITGVYYDAVLLDIRMPELDGVQVLEAVRQNGGQVPIILMTAYGTTETAIRAMKLGAFDYVLKPFHLEELLLTVERAVTMQRLAAEVTTLKGELGEDSRLDTIIGRSPKMQQVYKFIGKVADRNVTVLIQGESGTGKELVARAIHRNSRRWNQPFVKINCATIPEALLESELFGHERGAFTGAVGRKLGKFELAHRGTVFLDEIGELSPATQAKLLRFLQEKEFERVGGTETIRVVVRVLAATNRNLQRMVEEGTFREDLFFRLNVVAISLPPLRERKEDVPLLVEYFLKKYTREFNKEVKAFSPEAMDLLRRYDWPGNVRELENLVERAVVMADGPVVLPGDLPYNLQRTRREEGAVAPRMTLKEIVADVEREVILRALRENDWNRTATAAALGLNRRSLYAKMKEYGLL
ncbi:MAG: sigma-54-dependent Fis family transcriptional regulator [Firmicutes bacterium]|nr:sigma-54-dependent Fis family transcriptional regulator [Bacillota bacterium]